MVGAVGRRELLSERPPTEHNPAPGQPAGAGRQHTRCCRSTHPPASQCLASALPARPRDPQSSAPVLQVCQQSNESKVGTLVSHHVVKSSCFLLSTAIAGLLSARSEQTTTAVTARTQHLVVTLCQHRRQVHVFVVQLGAALRQVVSLHLWAARGGEEGHGEGEGMMGDLKRGGWRVYGRLQADRITPNCKLDWGAVRQHRSSHSPTTLQYLQLLLLSLQLLHTAGPGLQFCLHLGGRLERSCSRFGGERGSRRQSADGIGISRSLAAASQQSKAQHLHAASS